MTEDIVFSCEGQLGLITLNRPNALNALTQPMIQALYKQLVHWKMDSTIHAVVLKAAPGNAFCAGGDVRWLYNAGKTQDPQQLRFFWHEYRLNQLIHHFGKPYIALMDGITMGGGVGISMHGSHAVASERFVFAMPETGIGFFPDIGASYLLNRCSDSLGIYLGLTGARLGWQDALKAGLVNYCVASDKMPALLNALIEADLSENPYERVDEVLKQVITIAFEEASMPANPLIKSCFSLDNMESIQEALHLADGAWALGVETLLKQKSPTSLKVTLAQLQKTKGLSLDECLRIDYELAGHFMQSHDFYEGVRALLIDKDKSPQWIPASLELITEAMVVGYFERGRKTLDFKVDLA